MAATSGNVSMTARYDPPSTIGPSPADPADRSYFFDEGLRFECTQCGACCSGAPGQVYVSPTEIEKIAAHLGVEADAFIRTHCRPIPEGYSLIEKAGGDCIFLNDRQCSIHALKPNQCATYPFWVNNLRNETRWKKACGDCEGIGRGRRYTREEILRILDGQEKV